MLTLTLFGKKKIIAGCESRGDADSPYLTRWTLLDVTRKGESLFGIYLHRFHRSDHDEMHDHPWAYVSLILWPGYVEESRVEDDESPGWFRVRKRVWPGMVLFRRADHVHRVELVDGRESLSLFFRWRRVREWGFHTPRGWQRWREYFSERGC